MLKHVSICATLVALATIPLKAQQWEAVLQQVELPGVGFNLVLATPKSPSTVVNLGLSPEALIAPLIGGALALSFDDGAKMTEAIDTLQHPACAFQAESKDGNATTPVSVYVVPKRGGLAGIRTASLGARVPEDGMRKVEVPGNDFDIVLATTRTPPAREPHERPDALAVYSAGSELMMASDGDIERMFKGVGLSRLPTCIFEVERKGSNPSQAASLYIVPKGETNSSSPR